MNVSVKYAKVLKGNLQGLELDEKFLDMTENSGNERKSK